MRDRQHKRRLRTFAVLVLASTALIFGHEGRAVANGHRRAAAGATDSAGDPLGTGVAVDPSAFSRSACMSYAPLSGNRHLTVFLDAGHGGLDPGGVGATASGRSIDEANLTLPVELDAMAILRRDGFRVVVSRTAATSVVRLSAADTSGGLLTIQGAHDDVAARAICANDAHAAVLVGIYFDAGSSTSNAGSVTGYDTARPFAASNLRLATLVQDDVLAAMNARGWSIPDEGVLSDDALGSAVSAQAVSYDHLMLLGPAEPGYFTTPSLMPGALIEPLFITDPFEASIADSAIGQEVIAGGIAKAVEQYFDPSAPGTATGTPAS